MMDGVADPERAILAAGATFNVFPSKPIGRARTQDAPAAGRMLPLRDPCSWTGPAPARQWNVRDWIPRGTVTAKYGDGGVGKSLLAQQLLTSTALGQPWLGLDTLQGRALGIFCEDSDEELHRRQEAINAALGIGMQDLSDLRLLSRLGSDNVLMDFGNAEKGALTDFFNDVDATLRAWRPVLATLDTAADLFGGNENARPEVRRFIGACLGRLARDHDCGLVLLAHPSSSGLANGSGTGGSTAWSNTVRSRLYLTRPGGDDEAPDTNRRTLTRMKANYAAKDGAVEIEWHAGAFRLWQPGMSTMDDPATWQAIGAMFDEIERAWNAGTPWSPAAQTRESGRYFPVWARSHLGLPEKRVRALLIEWMATGCLVNDDLNRKAKTRGLRVVRRPA